MDIERSLELSSKATPGPWRVDETVTIGAYGVWADFPKNPSGQSKVCGVFEPFGVGSDFPREMRDANAAFIADARENFPELLKRFKRLRELLDHDSLMLPDSTCVEVRSLLSLDGNDGHSHQPQPEETP